MSDKIRFLNPDALYKPPGYTHVVEAITPGRLVYVAGQLGLDRGGHLADGFAAQAALAFENLKAALTAVGADFRHVVKLNNYIVDIRAHLPILREVRDRYLDKSAPPASTTIEVTGLAKEGAVFEVEAVAVLPN